MREAAGVEHQNNTNTRVSEEEEDLFRESLTADDGISDTAYALSAAVAPAAHPCFLLRSGSFIVSQHQGIFESFLQHFASLPTIFHHFQNSNNGPKCHSGFHH